MTKRIGDHVLQFGDGGGDWCRICGEFDVYLKDVDGKPTKCVPKPEEDRWWDFTLDRFNKTAVDSD